MTLTRQERWEQRTSVPLLVLAFVFLIAWSIATLATNLPPGVWDVLISIVAFTWLLFVVDYVVQVALAKHRFRFILHHIPDLVAVVLPFLRPAVQLTHVRATPLLHWRTGTSERIRIVALAAAFALLYVYSISLAVFSAERDAVGTKMHSYGDALWWAFVTIFTVGYGDVYPVTPTGRVLAVLLMFGGLIIIGVATATVVSYLNERVRRHPVVATTDGEDDPDPVESD